jgi:general secretion pathway protein J
MSIRQGRGFTLVELLVALTVMAVLTGLAWTGIDGLLRTREATREALDRTQRLSTVLTQWEQDLNALYESAAVPPLKFDGRTLRLTRTDRTGVRVVTWTLREGTWYRWTGPVVQRADELQQSWLGSQQHQGGESGEVRLIDGVTQWQLYYFRGNAWSNAQSSGEVQERSPGNPDPNQDREDLPDGVRLLITLPAGPLTRDLIVPAQAS